MNSTSTYILGIESSCDDTGAAVWCDGKILANVVAGQDVHTRYGGVVPELAGRAHQGNIVPVVDAALRDAGLTRDRLGAVACTFGPGLMGSLLVGTSFARAFSQALHIPLISVNHIEAHVMSVFIEEPRPRFPFLCLVISGGHTHIFKVSSPSVMEVIGKTTDDAAGEAFDKAAKMLGFPYPGGPLIDKHAISGNPLAFKFKAGTAGELDFSFSGFKTSVLYFLQKQVAADPGFIQKNLDDLCASVQYTIVNDLVDKLVRASELTGIREIGIAGGVAANRGLRAAVQSKAAEKGWNLYIPQFKYCTDNAAMIACAGSFKYEAGDFAGDSVQPFARAEWSR